MFKFAAAPRGRARADSEPPRRLTRSTPLAGALYRPRRCREAPRLARPNPGRTEDSEGRSHRTARLVFARPPGILGLGLLCALPAYFESENPADGKAIHCQLY